MDKQKLFNRVVKNFGNSSLNTGNLKEFRSSIVKKEDLKGIINDLTKEEQELLVELKKEYYQFLKREFPKKKK